MNEDTIDRMVQFLHDIVNGRTSEGGNYHSTAQILLAATHKDEGKLVDEDGICLTCGDLRSECTGDTEGSSR